MRRLPLLLGLLFATSVAMADVPAPIKIPVRHADPWMIKALLEGMAVQSPEMSSLPGFQGLGQNAGNAVGSFIRGGRLVVNPTDNSLWFFPDRASG
jgi:hypothetical protein